MKPEPQKDIASVNCYDQYLIRQSITEKQGDIQETIGHMTVCARKFLAQKPLYITDFLQALSFALPECKTCVRELTSFRKSIMVDFTKTKRTKEQIHAWISEQVRKGCHDFTYDPNYKDNSEMLPNPTVPSFGDYNPDQFIEPAQNTGMVF